MMKLNEVKEMLTLTKRLWTTIITVSLIFALAACGVQSSDSSESANANAGTGSEEIKGKIVLYTSQPDADAQALVDAFQKKHSNAEVEIFRSGTEEVISKLSAENEAGDVQADVLLVADSVTFERLKEKDLLMKYESSELSSIPKQFVDSEGMYTGTKVITTGIIINKENVKNIPDSWDILTQADSKDQIQMPSPLYSGAAAYNLGVLTRTNNFGWDFYQGMKDNGVVVGKGNGGVLKTVASGEKNYGMIIDFIVARAENEGSPVKFIYPKEGVPAITEPIGIIKNTDNPQVSKAFIDFVLSEEGQTLASDLGYAPVRTGIAVPSGLKATDEIKILSADNKELLKSRDSDKKKFSNVFE